MNLYNLFSFLNERGTAKTLSKITGISTGNISDWKSGRSKPGIEALEKIADYFNCSVDYLIGRTQLDKNTNTDMGKIIELPTYIQPVSAGKGNIVMDGEKVIGFYPSTPVSSKATYCARISGNSMQPKYMDGDIVYVDSKEIPLHNDIGIFLYNGESYCKKLYNINGVQRLISLNSEYAPIEITNSSLKAQGKVIGRFYSD